MDTATWVLALLHVAAQDVVHIHPLVPRLGRDSALYPFTVVATVCLRALSCGCGDDSRRGAAVEVRVQGASDSASFCLDFDTGYTRLPFTLLSDSRVAVVAVGPLRPAGKS